MKTQKIVWMIGAACLLGSCADTDMTQFSMKEPESLATYDYLKGYDVLKNYDAHLGVILDAQAFLDKGMAYRMAAANFAELEPTSLMNHACVVKASGDLDTTKIAELRDLAKKHQINLISEPLVSDLHQNVTYLNSKIAATVIHPDGEDGGYCLKMTNTQVLSKLAEAQVAYTFAKTPRVEPGITYKLKMWVHGTAEGNIQVATYANGKGSVFKPNIKVTKDWTYVEVTNTIVSGMSGMSSILFNLGNYVGTLYVDDIELVEFDTDRNKEVGKNLNTVNTNLDDAETTASSLAIQTNESETLEDVGVSALGEGYDPNATYVEKTAQEKNSILTAEMQHYVENVVATCKDVVSDWIVVSNPLDEVTDDASHFYWQSYLGATDYAVKSFAEAAKHTQGKLYIAQDDALTSISQCEQLVAYVQSLESQGAGVDGYALNVAVSTDDDQTMATISQTLQKLAATGKMIRLMDVQVVIGDDVSTADVTEEQLQAQANVLGQLVKAYRDAVPEAQRGGITFHTLIDDESGSPLGLWDASYNRKHAYGALVKQLTEN